MNKMHIYLFVITTIFSIIVASQDYVYICQKPGTTTCVSNIQGAHTSSCGDCSLAWENCGYCRVCKEGCSDWCNRVGGNIKMIDYTVYNYESSCENWVKG